MKPETAQLTDWYEINNADSVPSPALLVYPDRIRQNIRAAIEMTGDVNRFRPHVKTHKMRAVTDMLLAEGVRKFKCATIAEAEMLAQAGAPDVLIAYAVVGPMIGRLRQLIETYPNTHVACLIDHADAAQKLADAFADHPLDVYIDLNVGMNRTGIVPASAFALFEHCQDLTGLRVVGLHAYDGHLRDTDLAERIRKADEAFAAVTHLQQQILDTFEFRLSIVIGGSPTFPCHTRRAEVEPSPGTFVFWDAGYASILPDLPFVWAAVLLMRIISIIDDRTICLDLGHKAVAAENPLPRVFLSQLRSLSAKVRNTWWYALIMPNATNRAMYGTGFLSIFAPPLPYMILFM